MAPGKSSAVPSLTSWNKVEPVGIDGQRGDGVQMRNHGMCQLASVVVEETDVAIFMRRDCQGQCWVRNHFRY